MIYNKICNLINTNNMIDICRSFFMLIFSILIFIKFMNIKNVDKRRRLIAFIIIMMISVFSTLIKIEYNKYYCLIFQIISLAVLNIFMFNSKIKYAFFDTIVAFATNFIIYSISVIISFIPNKIFKIENDYINIFIILIINILLAYIFLKNKRIKNGIVFLRKKVNDESYNLLIINISIIILFIVLLLTEDYMYRNVFIYLMSLFVIMFITIKKSIELYYKQTLMVKDLEETKKELKQKEEEIKRLEEENIQIHKKNHSIAHKQNSLEYKLNKIINNGYEMSKDGDIKEQIEELSKEIFNKQVEIELEKTDIIEIDDMLKYMQSECIKNDIEFCLQINGNIHYMINNIISKSELQILIADHIKDAIIAIKSSNSTNRSILVRLGKIDNIFSLYIYDSGIKFEEEILEKLGKEPVTTHANDGGTGIGYMNTFDTLKTHEASLIIKQYSKQSLDNYTKVIMIKFDGKNEYKYFLNNKSYPQKEEGVLKSE